MQICAFNTSVCVSAIKQANYRGNGSKDKEPTDLLQQWPL